MPTVQHKQKIRELKQEYEAKNYACKEQYPLFNPETNSFSLIDLSCFGQGDSVAFEIEKSGAQVLKNAQDLLRFKKAFNGRICQLNPVQKPESTCDDFKKISNTPDTKNNKKSNKLFMIRKHY